MSSPTIQTVTGSTTPEALGKTLMHEHLVIGYPGWEADTLRPGPDAAERYAVCVDRIEEMKGLGFTSIPSLPDKPFGCASNKSMRVPLIQSSQTWPSLLAWHHT